MIARFWSDTASDCGRNSLHVAISGIRRWLEKLDRSQYYITFQDNMYSFNPAIEVDTDVSFFQKYFQEAWQLEQQDRIEDALHAYLGHFVFIGIRSWQNWRAKIGSMTSAADWKKNLLSF